MGPVGDSRRETRWSFLGRVPYAEAFELQVAAREALARGEGPERLLLLEHPHVYTLGRNASTADVLLAPSELAARGIAVAETDRGGQVTYHGPGQVVAYPLLDLRRLGIYVKEYVFRIEEAVLDALGSYGITGHRVRGAPGIYVRLADPFGHARLAPPGADPFAGLGKIAALGIKVSRQCSYHGVALNVAMDLEPFSRIDPCGYAGLRTVDLRSLGVATDVDTAAARLAAALDRRLG